MTRVEVGSGTLGLGAERAPGRRRRRDRDLRLLGHLQRAAASLARERRPVDAVHGMLAPQSGHSNTGAIYASSCSAARSAWLTRTSASSAAFGGAAVDQRGHLHSGAEVVDESHTISAAPALSTAMSWHGPGSPASTPVSVAALAAASPPQRCSGSARAMPTSSGSTPGTRAGSRRSARARCWLWSWSIRRSVVAGEHRRPLGPERTQRTEHPGGHRRVGHPDRLTTDPRRVGERTEEVEGGGNAELLGVGPRKRIAG